MPISKEDDDLCVAACRMLLDEGEKLLDTISDAIKGCSVSKIPGYVDRRMSIAKQLREVREHLEAHKRGEFLKDSSEEHDKPSARVN